MEFMKKIILTACILSIVITVSECIKPGEKFNSQLKTIFSLIFIIGIVMSGIKTGIDFELPDYNDFEYNENYNDVKETAQEVLKSEVEARINSSVEDILKKNNISYEKIASDVNINEDGRIDINRIAYKGTEFEQARTEIEKSFTNTEVSRIE